MAELQYIDLKIRLNLDQFNQIPDKHGFVKRVLEERVLEITGNIRDILCPEWRVEGHYFIFKGHFNDDKKTWKLNMPESTPQRMQQIVDEGDELLRMLAAMPHKTSTELVYYLQGKFPAAKPTDVKKPDESGDRLFSSKFKLE